MPNALTTMVTSALKEKESCEQFYVSTFRYNREISYRKERKGKLPVSQVFAQCGLSILRRDRCHRREGAAHPCAVPITAEEMKNNKAVRDKPVVNSWRTKRKSIVPAGRRRLSCAEGGQLGRGFRRVPSKRDNVAEWRAGPRQRRGRSAKKEKEKTEHKTCVIV